MYFRVNSKAGRLNERRRQVDGDTAQDAVRRVEAWLRLEQERRQFTGEAGRVDGVIEHGGGHSRYVYDEQGDLLEMLEPDGQRRRYVYDGQRRLTMACHSDGPVTTYTYGDSDRLVEVNDRGVVTCYEYDPQGRMTRVREGRTGAVVYVYNQTGRISMARTPRVSTTYEYDDQGRMIEARQSMDGIILALRLAYDRQGHLETMILPGSDCPIRYSWDHRGRPVTVALNDKPIAGFSYQHNVTRTVLGNGLAVTTRSSPEDGRPASNTVSRGDQTLFEQHLRYNAIGEVISDGEYRYAYDTPGRLIEAEESATGRRLGYEYDRMDNRISLDANSGESVQLRCDRQGRLVQKSESGASWNYRYDDAGRLTEVMRRGRPTGRFTYDHKGRLVLAEYPERSERYFYGPSDELLAVTDAHGDPKRLFVRTPLGLLAEVRGSLESGDVFYIHTDARRATRLFTNEAGEAAASFSFDPFGLPAALRSPSPGVGREAHRVASHPWERQGELGDFQPHFGNHVWHSEIGLYYCGARWYDPASGRFTTPDTFTGCPDDARIVNPVFPSSRQALARDQLLGGWLKQPRLRNRYVFCNNDPVGRFDPDGHWSFGGVVLTILGAIWTLPNTLIGLFIEITCLVGEVIRWLVWLVTIGHVSWQTPGFDAAASDRLNAFALVFEGGWFGSLPLLGMTFGNVFFVSDDWKDHPATGGPGDVFPEAYQGRVAIPRTEALYEHELRHTKQYSWFGPIYLFVQLIDWMASGFSYCDMWLERDARRYAGL
jgi:RHS repeat-associated protein